jgi:hypothetical protein
MLGVMYGVSAMIPITFGVAGYALVSRDGDIPNSGVTAERLLAMELADERAINVGTLDV